MPLPCSKAYHWNRRADIAIRAEVSTCFLHVPYAYGIPMVTTSAVLHWLISQSFFVGIIESRPLIGQPMTPESTRLFLEPTVNLGPVVAFSPIPLLCILILGIILVLILLALACRKLQSSIPVARSCSLALSAACHPPAGDAGAAYSLLRWGALDYEPGQEIGHFCFTTKEVHAPVAGRPYA